MSPATAISIDPQVFNPDAISKDAHAFNQQLIDIMSTGPKFYEVGAAKYREMRMKGETPLPPAVLLDSAEKFEIPSRDKGRNIPCRVFKPTNGSAVKGVLMHIHGGGWVLQDEASQDTYLQDVANESSTTVISIGYRLAPENPYPAGPNDCFDAAEWLVHNAESQFSKPLSFIAGESAGGHLTMLTTLHLLQHPSTPEIEKFSLKGIILHFGAYDLTFSPSTYNFNPPGILVLDKDIMEHYRDAFLPGKSGLEFKNPDISPLYADLQSLRGRLPPALFTCGTMDCLLDDTVFMSCRWMMAGGETAVEIVPGAAHAYIYFPRKAKGSGSDVGLDRMEGFMREKLG